MDRARTTATRRTETDGQRTDDGDGKDDGADGQRTTMATATTMATTFTTGRTRQESQTISIVPESQYKYKIGTRILMSQCVDHQTTFSDTLWNPSR